MDWKIAIVELQGFGLTQPQIAERCHCQQTTISALATGKTKDPRHSLGERLKDLLATKQREAAEKAEADAVPPGCAPGGSAATGGDRFQGAPSVLPAHQSINHNEWTRS